MKASGDLIASSQTSRALPTYMKATVTATLDNASLLCLQCSHMAETLGLFEQAVLLAIVRLGEKAYGRAVHREVADRLGRDVAAGAVFSTLGRLEKKKLLTSQLGPGGEERGGRPRRYYAVRPAGIQALNESRDAMDAIWHRMPKPLR